MRAVRAISGMHTPSGAPADLWRDQLARGDLDGAWDAFLGHHRSLILATVRRLVADPGERVEAFSDVCAALSADGLARLRRFVPGGPARFSTWLVVVVRNLLVDHVRRDRGRRRRHLGTDQLSPLQQQVFTELAERGRTYVEAFESLVSRGIFSGDYGAFLGIVRDLHRVASSRGGPLARELIGVDPSAEVPTATTPSVDSVLDCQRALAALASVPADVRVATLLFVVDDVPADEVARIVGWPDRKAVYNRVSRALATVRRQLAPDPAE